MGKWGGNGYLCSCSLLLVFFNVAGALLEGLQLYIKCKAHSQNEMVYLIVWEQNLLSFGANYITNSHLTDACNSCAITPCPVIRPMNALHRTVTSSPFTKFIAPFSETEIPSNADMNQTIRPPSMSYIQSDYSRVCPISIPYCSEWQRLSQV